MRFPLKNHDRDRHIDLELLRLTTDGNSLVPAHHVEASFLASLEIVREAVFLWKMPLETPL